MGLESWDGSVMIGDGMQWNIPQSQRKAETQGGLELGELGSFAFFISCMSFLVFSGLSISAHWRLFLLCTYLSSNLFHVDSYINLFPGSYMNRFLDLQYFI